MAHVVGVGGEDGEVKMEAYQFITISSEQADHCDIAMKMNQTLEENLTVKFDDEHWANIQIVDGRICVSLMYGQELIKQKLFDVESIVGLYEFEGAVIEIVEE